MKALLISTPLLVWVLFILSSIVWILYPQIDLDTAALFYTPNEGFLLKGVWWETVLYKSVAILLMTYNLGALVLIVYNRIRGKNIAAFDSKKLFFVLLVLIIGSGLIVNALLKDNWGRARPGDIVEFGGNRSFTPAFIISDQEGNSFSSGHASGAFALLAFALLAQKRRNFWIGLSVAYGAAVGYARMAAGGHFLSDVVVSFFIMYITAKVFYYLLFEREEKESLLQLQ